MGRSRRNHPLKLGQKLHTIRVRWLRLSQTEMAKALGLKVHYTAVSHFELGTREPSLDVLLKYARLAGISMEVLVDDKLDLPRLPLTRDENVSFSDGTGEYNGPDY